MQEQRGSTEGIASRLASVVFGLLILGVAWWYMGLDWIITGAIAAVIIIGGILPPMIGAFAGAAGWFALAALTRFYYGAQRLPIALAVVGVIFLVMAIGQAARARGIAQRQGD